MRKFIAQIYSILLASLCFMPINVEAMKRGCDTSTDRAPKMGFKTLYEYTEGEYAYFLQQNGLIASEEQRLGAVVHKVANRIYRLQDSSEAIQRQATLDLMYTDTDIFIRDIKKLNDPSSIKITPEKRSIYSSWLNVLTEAQEFKRKKFR